MWHAWSKSNHCAILIQHMRKDRHDATNLRRRGKSYNEIKAVLGVPKSTLSDWLSATSWSRKIKGTLSEEAKIKSAIHIRALNAVYRKHLAKIYHEARAEALQEFEHFKLHPLFIAGIGIYWGEGDKSSLHQLRLANTDPAMIKTFVRFLDKICGAPKEKIRAYILLYPDLDQKRCVRFWVRESGLPRKNFNKCVTIQGRHRTRRIKYGVCTVGISSRYLKEKMCVWLSLLPKELARNTYYPRE